MSQFGDDRVEAGPGREWSDADMKHLGNMLVRGLSYRGTSRVAVDHSLPAGEGWRRYECALRYRWFADSLLEGTDIIAEWRATSLPAPGSREDFAKPDH